MTISHIDRGTAAMAEAAEKSSIEDASKTRLSELYDEPIWVGPGETILVRPGTILIAGEGPKRIISCRDGLAPQGRPIISDPCIIGLYETLISYPGSTGFCVEATAGPTPEPAPPPSPSPGPIPPPPAPPPPPPLRAERVWCYRVPYAELGRLNDEVPWVRHLLRTYYESMIEKGHLWLSALERGFQDYFLTENAGLVPGPYRSEDVEMKVFVMEERVGKLHALLPPRTYLIPFVPNRYLLVFCSWRDFTTAHAIGEQRKFDFTETTVFVPAWSLPLCPGAFTPELFPDNYLAILLGRELYGFPKRYGYTQGREIWKKYCSAVLFVDDKPEAEASWDGEEPLTGTDFFKQLAGDFLGHGRLAAALSSAAGSVCEQLNKRGLLPDAPLFVRRQVPATAFPWEDEPFYQTDQLVRIPFDISDRNNFHEPVRLKNPKLKLHGAALPVGGRCVNAYGFKVRKVDFGQASVCQRYDYPRRQLGLISRGLTMQLLNLANVGKRVISCFCEDDPAEE